MRNLKTLFLLLITPFEIDIHNPEGLDEKQDLSIIKIIDSFDYHNNASTELIAEKPITKGVLMSYLQVFSISSTNVRKKNIELIERKIDEIYSKSGIKFQAISFTVNLVGKQSNPEALEKLLMDPQIFIEPSGVFQRKDLKGYDLKEPNLNLRSSNKEKRYYSKEGTPISIDGLKVELIS